MPLRKNLKNSHHAYRLKKKKKINKIPFVIILLLLAGGFFYIKSKPKTVKSEKNSVVEKVTEIIPVKSEKKKESDSTPLVEEIETYLANQTGEYGYSIIELDQDGKSFGKRDENMYVAASTVKVGIAAYVYKQIELGKTTPDKLLTYTSADYEGGTGSLQASPVGSKFKVSYLLERMLKVSDNVATNILIRTYGRSNIQKFLDENKLAEINLVKNEVTPSVMAELLAKVYRAEIVNSSSATEIQNIMKKSIDWNTRIDGGVPESVSVAHKIGTQTAAISDIAIIYLSEKPYVLSVYSKKVVDEATPKEVIKNISQKVYNYELQREN